jgi:rSAM/selenodomain-associated transferase 1
VEKNEKTAIAIFLGYPEPGKVKARLAEEIGDKRAALIYGGMIEHVLRESVGALMPAQFEAFLFCDPFKKKTAYETYFSEFGFPIEMQEGNDLGQRLAKAFEKLVPQFRTVLAIGVDCLGLEAEHLEEAIAKLQSESEVVLGPTLGGKFYLMGMKEYHPTLFENIPWGSNKVLEQTMERARINALPTFLLDVLKEIDSLEDLRKNAFSLL